MRHAQVGALIALFVQTHDGVSIPIHIKEENERDNGSMGMTNEMIPEIVSRSYPY